MTRTQDVAGLIPPEFLTVARGFSADDGAVGGPSGREWADRLPRLLADTLDTWELEPAGTGHTGHTAVVLPVLRGGETFMLKLVWPHLEGRDEALVLRHWDGRGAVRLLAADPSNGALLLEALDPTRDLRTVDIDTACTVTGELLAQLHVPAPPQLTRLSSHVRHHTTALLRSDGVLPRRMLDRTAGLIADLLADPACDATLLHTDLHYENILAAKRAPWLAIDPHALAGHPGFEIQPLLRNRRGELGAGSAFRYLVRRRLEIACDAAGIDRDQGLAWTYVHTVIQAGWAAADGNEDDVTFCVALLKALDG